MSIMAWRYWAAGNLGSSSNHRTLFGAKGFCWPIEKTFTAICAHFCEPFTAACTNTCEQRCPPNTSPNTNCHCGIYALKQPTVDRSWWWWEADKNYTEILGIVQLSGKIITAEYGYRAQYANISALVDAPPDVSTRYRVPNLPSVEYARKEYFS